MNRRETREAAFKLIFESLFRQDTPDEIIELADNVDEIEINDDVVKIFKGTISNSDKINEIIKVYSEKRQFERIPKVNIAILQLAIYEILFDDRVPTNVAISEAVLISKKYAHESDVIFINGVLGAYSKSLGKNV